MKVFCAMRAEAERCSKTWKRPLEPSNGQCFEEDTGQCRKMHRGVSAIIAKFVVHVRTNVW